MTQQEEIELKKRIDKMQTQFLSLSISVATLSNAQLNLQKSVLDLTQAMKELLTQMHGKEHNP